MKILAMVYRVITWYMFRSAIPKYVSKTPLSANVLGCQIRTGTGSLPQY